MSDLQELRLRLAAARADFLDSGDTAGVPALVAASWQRSRTAGVRPETYAVPYSNDIDTDSRLARCARPVLQRLTDDMSDVPVSIALADARARIIDRRDCSNAVGRVLDRVDFHPGYGFGESGVGTNGIGTVFEAGQPVSVIGAAHFNDALTPFACTGAPVIDPITGRLEGVLDVSLLADSWNPLLQAMVRTAASDIGRNLMLDRDRAQQALFETYRRADARSRHAVMAVGDTVILNGRAQQLLTSDEQGMLQLHARYLMGRPDVTSDHLTLPDGRALHLRVLRVSVGDDTSGVVLLVSEFPHDLAAASTRGRWTGTLTPDELPEHLPASLEPLLESRSATPAWNQARAETCRALLAEEPLILHGEPGSGRLTLLTDIFAALHPEGDQLVVEAHRATSTSLDLDRNGPVLLVLRDLEQLDGPAAQAAVEMCSIAAEHERVHLAATLGGTIDQDHPAGALLRHFVRTVSVPALRHRGEDLHAIVAILLTELAPGRRFRVSPQAQRVLAAYHWPGNVPQLRDALTCALKRRPVGEIDAEDLPGYCRSTTSRSLSGMESAERDAIVAALEAQHGNRVQAAQKLGISRSSLYRKLKQYGLNAV